MTENKRSHLVGEKGYPNCGKTCSVEIDKNMSIPFNENQNITIHVPKGHLATLQTKDFKTYTVKLAKI